MTCVFQRKGWNIGAMPSKMEEIQMDDVDWFGVNEDLKVCSQYPGICCICRMGNLPMDQATFFSATHNGTSQKMYKSFPCWLCSESCKAKLLSCYYFDERYLLGTKSYDMVESNLLFHRKLVPDEEIKENFNVLSLTTDARRLSRELWYLQLPRGRCCQCGKKDSPDVICLRLSKCDNDGVIRSVSYQFYLCSDLCATRLLARYQSDGRYLLSA